MHTGTYNIGVDVGGSHISCALVDNHSGKLLTESAQEVKIDSNGSISHILDSLRNTLTSCCQHASTDSIKGVGIAMPGPFDYNRGIAKIAGVQKFDAIYGLNLKQEIRSALGIDNVQFENDATCFALGEYYAGAAKGVNRALVITLGTGFGSTFLVNGVIQTSGDTVPANGYFYNLPFGNSIADNYFSTRWFVNRWKEKTGDTVSGVKEIAELAKQNNTQALQIFEEFASNLSEFLTPWMKKFDPNVLVLGGSIARASNLFLEQLTNKLQTKGVDNPNVKSCQLWDEAPVVGAAMNVKSTSDMNQETFRKTTQILAPEKSTPTGQGNYDIYPAFPVGNGKIQEGDEALATWIAQHKTVVIDGYEGVLWDVLMDNLTQTSTLKGKTIRWFHADAALRSPQEIEQMIAPFMGEEDSIFGKITSLQLPDFFHMEKLQQMLPDSNAEINVIVGCGAALAGWKNAALAYIDVPKNELQFRMRAGSVKNLGADTTYDGRIMYKRAYFIDWRILNNHKCALLPKIDLIVDEQRPDALLIMDGNTLRDGLTKMSRNFFRVRPWFEPGAWGGTWMREHLEGVNKEVSNLAWSFELMVLENGLMFESDGYRLEVSFDFLMYNNYQAVLGDCAERFKYDFPIRFDFLDTFDGGNLSVQCHPRPEYIKKEFGMPFTQDETYYILDCKNKPVVYLGFQEGINPDEFHQALLESEHKAEKIDIERYVQKFDAKKHDFFLIPNGTIHASGKDNLVLEISSAPYIFTFKMYDWVRLDLDGRPRPINIEHGMKNVYFERKGDVVKNELISKPSIIAQDSNCVTEHLPTHRNHFYDVHRYFFNDSISIETNGKCHVWMLVEGQSVMLETADGMKQRFNYAETFVIPANTKSYTITNEGKEKVMMVKAFVK